MQIGEVAKRTSLTVDAIRFYEKRRLLPKAVRSAGRFRLYGEGTIERLHFIQQMQGLGFSLREVGELTDPFAQKDRLNTFVSDRFQKNMNDKESELGDAWSRRDLCWNWCDTISGISRVAGQAARSTG